MKDRILKVLFSRIRKMLICCLFLSALVSVFCAMKLLPDRSMELSIGLNIAAALFFAALFLQLRKCYRKVADKKVYYISSFCACALFVLINLALYFALPGMIYTFLFGITKVLRYSVFGLNSLQSALVFHMVVFSFVFISTIGMKWVFIKKAEYEAKKEKLPPKLMVNPLEKKTEDK